MLIVTSAPDARTTWATSMSGARSPGPAMLQRADANGARAGQPEDEVDVVDRGQERGVDVAVVLVHVARAVASGGDAHDVADPSGGDLGLESAIRLGEPQDVGRNEGRGGRVRRRSAMRAGRRRRRRDRFLEQDAHALAERMDGRLDVIVLAGRDAHAVGLELVDEAPRVAERPLDREAGAELLGASRRVRRQADDSDAGHRRIRAQVRLAHRARADDADPQLPEAGRGPGSGPPMLWLLISPPPDRRRSRV